MENEIYFNNDDRSEEDDFGLPIVPVFPVEHMLDYEWLVLSMESDHAKVILIRHFGLRGKKAAKAAGFSSEWSLYRREHELKKVLERQRDQYFG